MSVSLHLKEHAMIGALTSAQAAAVAQQWPAFLSRVNLVTKGAVAGRQVEDFVTNSTNQGSSATAAFTQADVGSLITICDQNNYANIFSGTVASVQSATNITLSGAASFTATGCGMAVGPDNATAISNAISSLSVSNRTPVLLVPTGIFLTSALMQILDGQSIEGQGWAYGLCTTPIAAGSALLLAANKIGTGNPFFTLGNGSNSFSGNLTKSVMSGIGIDACNNAVIAVSHNGVRHRIMESCIQRGTQAGLVIYGQNAHVYQSTIGQHNIGNVLSSLSSDAKIIHNEIRQGGNPSMSNTTGHQIYVLATALTDLLIANNHLFSGFNGSISSGAQGANVYIRSTSSSPSISINVVGNTFDGTYGPEVVVRNEGSSRLSQINICSNEFFGVTGFPDNTFPVLSIEPVGSGSIRGINFSGNTGNGVTNNWSAMVAIEAGASGSVTGPVTHSTVTGNSFQNCDAMFAGTNPFTSAAFVPSVYGGNVIAENSTTVESKDANGGTVTLSGTGSQTAFTIAHGIAGTPTRFSVTAGNAASSGTFSVAAGSTNLTVTYAVAPANGTNNLSLAWTAGL